MPQRTQHDQLSIYNQVSTSLGEHIIQEIATDESTAVAVINKHYAAVVEAALTKTAWRFATVKKALNQVSAAPLNRWAAAWQLPPDLLKLLTIWPPGQYEMQGARIYTNRSTQLHIDYIRNVDPGEWPPWFVRYAVARLVVKCCKGITGDAPDTDMRDEVTDAASDALFQDAQQQPNQQLTPNDFIDCRY